MEMNMRLLYITRKKLAIIKLASCSARPCYLEYLRSGEVAKLVRINSTDTG
jgi:hypothetical protein